MAQSLRGYDAVLSPTVPLCPTVAERGAGHRQDPRPDAARDTKFFRVNALLLRNTSVVNMLDGCALSLPCHTPDELPVG
jgi:aspartyl-tRNA(Asn)/glutamyl-tRNA(Gln) amidotransferase subunit A